MPRAADLPLCGSSSSALLRESPDILRESGTSNGEKARAKFDPGSICPVTRYLSAPRITEVTQFSLKHIKICLSLSYRNRGCV